MAKIASFVELVEKFQSEADFVVVYIDEAHSSDGWSFTNNYAEIKKHKCLEDRVIAAKILTSIQEINCPLVLDKMSNEARYAYVALPERLYVVYNGIIEYEGGRGPGDYKVEQVEEWLEIYCKNKSKSD